MTEDITSAPLASSGPEPSSPVVPAKAAALPWPDTLSRLWAPALLVLAGWSFALSTLWQLCFLPLVYDLVLRAEDNGVRIAQAKPREIAAQLFAVAFVGEPRVDRHANG